MLTRIIILLSVLFGLSSCFEEKAEQLETQHRAARPALQSFSKSLPPPTSVHAEARRDFVGTPSEMVLDREQYRERHIEETHHLTIETPREALQQRYQRDLQQCIALKCEVLSSHINSQGFANIEARIPPAQLATYLDRLAEGPGAIASHQLNTNDRTMEYVDTQARLKNLTALRDRLLKLIAGKQFAKVGELLQVEREIARVQGQIDSLTGQLQKLQKVTQMATIFVNYQLPPRAVELEYHDIGNSLRYAWNGFLLSISTVIMFIAKALPWLPVVLIGIWILIATVRFAFRPRSGRGSKWMFWRTKPSPVIPSESKSKHTNGNG